MIHSLSGGIIADNDVLLYCKVEICEGTEKGTKRWYISPYPKIKQGDRVKVQCGFAGNSQSVCGVVERVDKVTKQTAPFPVNRTREIEQIIE